MSPEKALQDAIEICGGKHALAEELGVTRQAVHQWTVCPKAQVEAVEAAVARALERARQRKLAKPVSRYDLRPDLYTKVRK